MSNAAALLLSLTMAAAMRLGWYPPMENIPRTEELRLLAKECISPSLHHQFLHLPTEVSSSLWDSLSASCSLCAYIRGRGVCRIHTPVWGYALLLTVKISQGRPKVAPVVPTPLYSNCTRESQPVTTQAINYVAMLRLLATPVTSKSLSNMVSHSSTTHGRGYILSLVPRLDQIVHTGYLGACVVQA